MVARPSPLRMRNPLANWLNDTLAFGLRRPPFWRNHARESHARAGTPGQAPGKGCDDAGGRVRARRDPSRTGGQAWRPLGQAGNCDRAVEGTAGWGEAAGPASEREGQDEAEREERQPCRRAGRKAAVGSTFACDKAGAEAGAPERGLAESARAPGAERGASPYANVAQRRGTTVGAYERPGRAACSRPEGGAHASTPRGRPSPAPRDSLNRHVYETARGIGGLFDARSKENRGATRVTSCLRLTARRNRIQLCWRHDS